MADVFQTRLPKLQVEGWSIDVHVAAGAVVPTADIRLPSGVSLSVLAMDPIWLASLLRELGAC